MDPKTRQQAITLYLSGKSGTTVAKSVGITYSVLYRLLKKLKITRPLSEARRVYQYDQSFFSMMDTHEKAQVLGLWYADGNVSSGQQKILTMVLNSDDKDYLARVRSALKSQAPLRLSHSPDRRDVYGLHVCGERIHADIIKLGCMPRKSLILRFPTPDQVPSQFLSSFMLGYFEGDGCLYLAAADRKKDGYDRIAREGEFSITSTMEMCIGYGESLKERCGITYRIMKRHKGRQNNNYTLKINGNFQIAKVMAFLYSNAAFRMERKWAKYQELLGVMKRCVDRTTEERSRIRNQALKTGRCISRSKTVYLRSGSRVFGIRGAGRFRHLVGMGYQTLKGILNGETAHAIWSKPSEEEVKKALAAGTVDQTYW